MAGRVRLDPMSMADINGARIHYHEYGEGEPLVLISGLCGELPSWTPLVSLLKDDFLLVTLDNRGSGRTEWPEKPFSIETLASDVVGLMRSLGANRFHVLGASMGGNIAQQVAISQPDAVAGLVLVSTYLRRPPRSSFAIDAMIRSVQDGGSIDSFMAMMQSWCLTNSEYKGREHFRLTRQRKERSDELQMLRGIIAQKAALDGFDSRSTISSITAPTMVIHGTEDIMVPLRFGEEVAVGIEGAEMVRVEGAGHIIPAARYSPKMIDFLKRHSMK